MKKLILFFIFSLPLISYSQVETFPLESMIQIVNNSLDQAKNELGENNPKIQSAVITLKTTYNQTGGGGFKVFVKASRKWQLEKASTLTFSYNNIPRTNPKSVDVFKTPFFEKELTQAIIDAATQWQKTTSSIKGLHKNEFTVDISFMIKDVFAGGVEFEMAGVGLDLSGNLENAAVHSLKVSFR